MNSLRHDPDYDTTIKIWDYLYRVRLPYIQSRSIDDLKKYGVALTGVSEIDKDIKNQLITVMLPISQMVEYFKEGTSVRICSQSDVKEIYDSISDHIMAWKDRLSNGLNLGNSPIEDLIAMDQFAHAVYEHAKYHFTQADINTYAVKHFNNIQPINASNFFSKPLYNSVDQSQPGVIKINSEETLPERNSLADFFQNRLVGMRR